MRVSHDPEQSTWMLGTALKDLRRLARNAILDDAWEKYNWPDDG
jgi:hypothetical protein